MKKILSPQTKDLLLLLFVVIGFGLLILLLIDLWRPEEKINPPEAEKKEQNFSSKTTSSNSNNNNSKTMLKIRKPAVAGAFYPADAGELSGRISDFLNKGETDTDSSPAKMVIVPHAGYDYSGQVAAYGFQALKKYAKVNNIGEPTVIILAMSHHTLINGFAVDASDQWETPLGEVPLDKEMINKIAEIPSVSLDSSPFVNEHSLEVEVPFLQEIFPQIKIVPLLVGYNQNEDYATFARKLGEIVDKNTLLLVSSDLSHYPSYDNAVKADRQTIEGILSGDPGKFEQTISSLEKENIPAAETFACAQEAIKTALYLAKDLGLSESKLLKYANSGDVTGDKRRVVGYGAIAFAFPPEKEGKKEAEKEGKEGKKEDKKILVKMAQEVVESYVTSGKLPDLSSYQNIPLLQQKSGVFVTLYKNEALRGCIGLMESNKPLLLTLPQMAIAAAAHDPRFEPVSQDELSQISYEVSLLSPLQRVKSAEEIKLGTHGVKVRQGLREGVFLPQVATETGWSKEEFLSHLCSEKAGLPADCWKNPETEIYVFTAEVLKD